MTGRWLPWLALVVACDRSNTGIDPSVTLASPGGQSHVIDFTTDEGTGMSVAVSPDGTWLAFDLLGHIYRMPIAGGSPGSDRRCGCG